MALVTKPAVFVQGTPATYTLNKANLAAHILVAADSYYSNTANWREVSIKFFSDAGVQELYIVFDATQASPTADLDPSAVAEVLFTVDNIQIHDFDGGTYRVDRKDLITTEFDIAVGSIPQANNITIDGIQDVDSVLTANYTYFDPGLAAEGATTFQWYRSDDSLGTNATAIAGANAQTYTLLPADSHKYIYCIITPKALGGLNPGLATTSPFTNAITYTDPYTIGFVDFAWLGTAGSGPSAAVKALYVQPDSKILIGGDFVSVSGASLLRMARLNADGSSDATFNSFITAAGFDAAPAAFGLQADNSIIVGGAFTSALGNARGGILKLNSVGGDNSVFYSTLGSGFNAAVNDLHVQADDKIVVAGQYTALNGDGSIKYLCRLNADGTQDAAFNTALGGSFDNWVISILEQADGKITIGGRFGNFNGNVRNRITRLAANGAEDAAFYTNLGTGFDNDVMALAEQADNKILVAGAFTSLNGNTRNYVTRLNQDGTEDASFYANMGSGFNASVRDIHIQSDNKVVLVGDFTQFNGVPRNYIVRLNQDGTEDTTFELNAGTEFNAQVFKVTGSVSTEKLLVGGAMTQFNGSTINRLIKLD